MARPDSYRNRDGCWNCEFSEIEKGTELCFCRLDGQPEPEEDYPSMPDSDDDVAWDEWERLADASSRAGWVDDHLVSGAGICDFWLPMLCHGDGLGPE